MIVRVVADRCPPAQIWGVVRARPELVVKDSISVPVIAETANCDIYVFKIVTVILETVSGRRSISQLWRWVSPRVIPDIEVLARAYRGISVQLYRLRVQDQGNVKESAVMIKSGNQLHAVALRLELVGASWICTQLEWNLPAKLKISNKALEDS
ncbi:MAG: Rv3235 family protein [Propionibacteriaceae bacterium]